MQEFIDGNLRIICDGPAGSFANNLYILIDQATNEAAFVDAPAEPEKSIALAKAAGVRPSQILLTHSHGDHTAAIEALKAEFGCTLLADAAEPWLKEGQLDRAITHDEEVLVGSIAFRAVSVPGHTPGSTTFVHGKHAFVGDTLFPGGPGRTPSNAALQQELSSITTHLYALDGATTVYPGHGDRTTIAASMVEHALFAAKTHAPDLKGDVTWANS
jgi:glyoxylase-like metal-dependent hydrolase (beta-lactamase superfamily II)